METLGEAIIIVIVVIFLFLLDWRATIIPAITIPVSLVGTFAFIKIFGFSINSLTMFGITLATGLVVDDAIVVIENVQRHISAEHSDPHTATSVAMSEVTSAVIATSLVLISVFVPVSFFPGTTGILYRQFALTIAFAIAISAFNALTLSPALAALFLRGEKVKHGLVWPDRPRHSERPRRSMAELRITCCGCAISCCCVFVAGLASTVYLYTHVPTAFVPSEDQNYLICIVQAPPGASLSYTSNVADKAVKLIRQNKDVYGTFAVMGFSLSGGSSSNYGLIFVPLKAVELRTKEGEGPFRGGYSGTIFRPSSSVFPEVWWSLFEPPAIQGIGSFGGFQFELQDLGRNTLADLDRVAHQIVGASRQDKNLTEPLHQLYLERSAAAGRDRSRKSKGDGVSLSQISSTLERLHGIAVCE